MENCETFEFKIKINENRDKLFNLIRDNIHLCEYPNIIDIELISEKTNNNIKTTVTHEHILDSNNLLIWIPKIKNYITYTKSITKWDSSKYIVTCETKSKDGGDIYLVNVLTKYKKINENLTELKSKVVISLFSNSNMYYVILPFKNVIKNIIKKRLKKDWKYIINVILKNKK